MSTPIRFDVDAREDLAKSADWYEENTGRRDELLAAVAATLELMSSVPGVGAPVPGVEAPRPVRRALVAGFPFWIIYVDGPDELYVLAFAHQKRDPAYWLERVPSK